MTVFNHTQSQPHVAYRLHGNDGPPVLFIMGLGMPGHVWTPQIEALQSFHRCCVYDHLGVGKSSPPPRRPTIRSMVDDALRVVDDVGWDRVHVVGVSMGGMVAQELALQRQDRCKSLTLIATHGGAPFAGLPRLKGLRCFVDAIRSSGKERAEALERLLYPPHFIQSLDPEERRRGTTSRLDGLPPLRTILKQVNAALRHRAEARLRQLTLPTLLVRPGMDILIRPSQIDRIAKRIPHAQVLRFDDAGHGVLFHKRVELNAALRRHFERSETQA